MTVFPTNMSRVPNLLFSRLALGNINRTNLDIFRVQQELSTGRALNLPSDDPVKSATVMVLDERLARSEQIARNLQHASSNLGVLDNALAEASTLALDAKGIAQTQLGIVSSPEERRSQAVIIDQLVQSLFNTATRTGPAGHFFGGSITSIPPIEQVGGGYRYAGTTAGLVTDIPTAGRVPITLAASNVIGATSARVRGTVDFDPNLTPDTRVQDLRGTRGAGVILGTIEFSLDSGPRVRVELDGADTIGQVAGTIERAIREAEAAQGITALNAGGVGVSGGALSFDAAPGHTIEFFDLSAGTTGLDLGLVGSPAFQITDGAPAGRDIDPRVTWRTPIAELAGITPPLGRIRLSNLGASTEIDLSTATTVEDLKNLIEGADLGVRVEINARGDGIDVLNEVAGSTAIAMSIDEVAGNAQTATRLGIRSLSGDTRIADFNDGRGVTILDSTINPATGQPDPTLDVDFRIRLGDGAGTVISVDLRPQDMATVQTVLDRINAEASAQLAAAGLPASALVAELGDATNGIRLRQDASFAGALRVEGANNSPAAEQLGLLLGRYDASSATLAGQDRARVRVDNLFTRLIDLRDALYANDTRGITLAGEGIERDVARLAETRGLVGGYAQRVDGAVAREEGRSVVDEAIRSELRDSDFSSAATRLALLQTQLQAGLRAVAQSQQLSLLDFLG